MQFFTPKPPTEAERAAWERIRSRGKFRYILTRGVLGWGLAMFVVMTLLHYYQGQLPKDGADLLFNILVGVVIWALGGTLFGWLTWHRLESRFE